nr:hypothetical protein [Plesiomonas shigelloides]
MFDIDSFAFDKVLICIVDCNGVIKNVNDDLERLLDIYHVYDRVGIDILTLAEKLPSYLKGMLSCCQGTLPELPIEFDNGYLSVFSHEFEINNITYKYVMSMFIAKAMKVDDSSSSLVVDELTGFYNKRSLETMPRLNGHILLIKLNGLINSKRQDDELIKRFSELLEECFLSDDVICRIDRGEFVIIRNVDKNNFHKNVLALKKKAFTAFKNDNSELWFSYVFEGFFGGDVYQSILSAQKKLAMSTVEYV